MGFYTLDEDQIVYKIVTERVGNVYYGSYKRTQWLLEMKIPKGSRVFYDSYHGGKHRSNQAIPLRCWRIEMKWNKGYSNKVLTKIVADRDVYAIKHRSRWCKSGSLWYNFGKLLKPNKFSRSDEQCAGGIHWYASAGAALQWVSVYGARERKKANDAASRKWTGQVA